MLPVAEYGIQGQGRDSVHLAPVQLSDSQIFFYPLCVKFSGGYIGGVTPVPISNTEVKPSRADGTPRETAWESRSLPDLFVGHSTFALSAPFFRLGRAWREGCFRSLRILWLRDVTHFKGLTVLEGAN